MARGQPHSSRSAKSAPALPPQLAAVNLHAAGIDVGAESHDVAVPPRDECDPVRCFGACTADLEALADGLATCGMTTVALESTGVSWMPLVE
jgi:transposase